VLLSVVVESSYRDMEEACGVVEGRKEGRKWSSIQGFPKKRRGPLSFLASTTRSAHLP
jgi:hypothetical protein